MELPIPANKIIALSCAAVLLTGCGASSGAADKLIKANASELAIDVTTDYEFVLPQAGEAAQSTESESGSIFIDAGEEENASDSGNEIEREPVTAVDIQAAEEIRNALTEDERSQRTYSLIFFDRPTVTGEELMTYSSVRTEEVAARMAEFADLFTPSRMSAEELVSWASLSDIDKTAIAYFVKVGWISREELAEKGIPYDDIQKYLDMDRTDSETLSENAEDTTLEADAMRRVAPTDISIAQSVFSKDRIEMDEMFLYTGNEINADSNPAFINALMDYINNHTKDGLYSMAQSEWRSMSTEGKRAFVYMLKLGWLEKGRLVNGQVSLAEVDRMYNLSFGK